MRHPLNASQHQLLNEVADELRRLQPDPKDYEGLDSFDNSYHARRDEWERIVDRLVDRLSQLYPDLKEERLRRKILK